MKSIAYHQLTKQFLLEWQTLWEQSSFATYANAPFWLQAVLRNFTFTEYLVIALYRNKKLVCVAPLEKEKLFGISCYTAAPNDFVCGMPFLLDPSDTEVLYTLVQELTALGVVVLDNLPSEFLHNLKQGTPNLAATLQTKNYFLTLAKDSNDNVVVPLREKLLRRAKRYEEVLCLKSFDGTDQKGLELAFAIDENSSKRTHGYPTFPTRQIMTFYQTLAMLFGTHFMSNILFFKDEPIAFEIGFSIGSTYTGSQIGFHKDYAFLSPGKVLAVRLLESFSKRPIEKIDFGSGDSELKQKLTKEYTELFHTVITKHFFVREYILLLFRAKEFGYTMLKKHKNIYMLYRWVKKALRVIATKTAVILHSHSLGKI